MNQRLMVINIYYAPHSFGGATIVAEEIATCLKEAHGWEILVVSSYNDPSLPWYSLRRFRSKGMNIVSINLPRDLRYEEEYDNPEVTRIVASITEQFQPDRVHVHSTQTLGCGYFDKLEQDKIKFVVTLHDCWWICERQFMIASDGRYCFQKKIDSHRCHYCVDDPGRYLKRSEYLRMQLSKADVLLAPSEFQRSIYEYNGFEADVLRVNKNGIRLPKPGFAKRRQKSDKVVFAFIGGPGLIKGAELIIKAFNSLPRHDQYALHVVDAAQNAGTTWKNADYWDIPGELEFVPSYNQENIDDFFATVDVLLFPSQWKESFGLTVREALVRNVWVIATEAGGVIEDIRDDENGTIIPLDGDYKPLLHAIEDCLAHEAEFWEQYDNPHKQDVRSFADQAKELDQILLS
jgi:glycosyltransferase involved in cell wall biosynthesis